MKLLSLDIQNFGKLKNREIDLSDGINIIYGYNETGKSTVHTFIRAMLYGMERGRGRAGRNDIWSKYEPWDDGANYRGSMRVSHNEHIYRIERNFAKTASEPLKIVDETTGMPVTPEKPFLDELLCGLSETSYNNTISIGQLKSTTDSGMASELRNYIANINTTGNMSLNISKAIIFLKNKKKEYTSQLIPEAAKTYTANLSEIKKLEIQTSSSEYTNKIGSLKTERTTATSLAKRTMLERDSAITRISSNKQILSDNYITSVEDVQTYADNLNYSYENYIPNLRNAGKSKLIYLGILLVILACISLGITAYMFIGGENNKFTAFTHLPYDMSVAVFSQIFIVLTILSYLLIKSSLEGRKRFEAAREELAKIIDIHLPGADLSEESVGILRAKFQKLYDICISLKEDEEQLEHLSTELERLNKAQEQYNTDIETQQHNQWELERTLEQLSNLKNENNILKKTIAENERIQMEISAIDLAVESMNSLSTSIRASFGMYLNKTTSELISEISGGVYNSMSIDENLHIFLNTRRKLISIEQVSSGTMDQVYLALRLATAKLMTPEGSELPLIFDDSFVNYDEERLKNAISWLADNYRGQILIFSCHPREAQLLASLMKNYNPIDL